MKTLFKLLCREKPCEVLIKLGTNGIKPYNSSKISKEVNSTYSHCSKIIMLLEELNLIERVKNGRQKHIRLTEKGQKLSDHLRSIKEVSLDIEVKQL